MMLTNLAKPLATLQDHTDWVTTAVFAPDGFAPDGGSVPDRLLG